LNQQTTKEACPDRALIAPVPAARGIVDVWLPLSQIDQRAIGIEHPLFSGHQVRD
jgi:hypothetical protein